MPKEKRLITTAIKKASAWGTEIDVDAAGNGLLALNAGVPKLSMPMIEDESPTEFEQNLDQGDKDPVDFSLDFDFRYEGLENLLVAMVMGTAGTPTLVSTSLAYQHTFQLKNAIEGLFTTYATEKHDKIHVVPSFKPYKLTFTYDGGKLKLTVDGKGDNLIDDSSTITSLSSVTISDVHNRALSRQGVFRMNAQAGAGLASGDEVKVKNFTLEIERAPESGAHEGGSQTIIEALEEGKAMVKLTLEMNRMDDVNDVYFSDWTSENEKKADFTFTGALIEDTSYYTALFQFPRLKIEDVEYADENIIPAKIILRGLLADSAPTEMNVTKPVQIDVTNKRSTDYLA